MAHTGHGARERLWLLRPADVVLLIGCFFANQRKTIFVVGTHGGMTSPQARTHIIFWCLARSDGVRRVFKSQPVGMAFDDNFKRANAHSRTRTLTHTHTHTHAHTQTHPTHRARAQEWASDDQRHNRWRSGGRHQRSRKGTQKKRDKTWQNSDPHEVR